MLKTRRERKIWMAGLRSKYIVIPRRIDIAGIHGVLKYHKGHKMEDDVIIPEQLGLLHHYRSLNDTSDTYGRIDPSMHRFTDALTRNIANRMDNVTFTR